MIASETNPVDPFHVEAFRGYLRLLIEHRLNPWLRYKLDMSGIVQETLWEAHRQLEQGKQVPSERRRAWLRQILTNNLSDAWRRSMTDKRDIQREVSLQQEFEQSSQRLEVWLAHELPPEKSLENAEQWQLAMTALLRLPEAQREAILLCHCDGLPLRDVAQRLGRTREAIAGLLKRGLKQLRAELSGNE